MAYCDPGGGGGSRAAGLVVLDTLSGRELWRIDGRAVAAFPCSAAFSDAGGGNHRSSLWSGRSSLRSGVSSSGGSEASRGSGLEGLGGGGLGKVTELAFSGDGGRLFVGGIDGGVGVFEVRDGIGVGAGAS